MISLKSINFERTQSRQIVSVVKHEDQEMLSGIVKLGSKGFEWPSYKPKFIKLRSLYYLIIPTP